MPAAVWARRAARAPRCRCRCPRAGSGRWTAWDRRRRTARRDAEARCASRHWRRLKRLRCPILVRGKQEHDLGLDRIRVLELVHEQPAILLLQRAAHVRVLRRTFAVMISRSLKLSALRRRRSAFAASRAFDQQRDAAAVEVLPPRREVGQHRVVPEVVVELLDLLCSRFGQLLVGPPLLR